MDRKQIKEEAKAKYKGNKWNILMPLILMTIIIFVITYAIELLGVPLTNTNGTNTNAGYIVNFIISMLQALFIVGYIKYMINFVRTGKFMPLNEALSVLKDSWGTVLLGYILITIFTSIGFVLLIVPGIILSLGFTMFNYLVADEQVTDALDGIKKSWNMMKGYKADLFVFVLSFFGWFLLCMLTLGILLIWIIPYYQSAITIYYEKLRQVKNQTTTTIEQPITQE